MQDILYPYIFRHVNAFSSKKPKRRDPKEAAEQQKPPPTPLLASANSVANMKALETKSFAELVLEVKKIAAERASKSSEHSTEQQNEANGVSPHAVVIHDENEVATKVQSSIRGFLARQRYKKV